MTNNLTPTLTVRLRKLFVTVDILVVTRDSIYAIARICCRPSVRLSDGWIIEKRLKLGL